MNFLELSIGIVFSLIFVVWVICMVSWIKRGMPIPRYLHYLAGALTLAGGVFLVLAFAGGFFHWKLGLACLALPAPATYIGWLWMFGPEFTSQSQDTTKKGSDPPAAATESKPEGHEKPKPESEERPQ